MSAQCYRQPLCAHCGLHVDLTGTTRPAPPPPPPGSVILHPACARAAHEEAWRALLRSGRIGGTVRWLELVEGGAS